MLEYSPSRDVCLAQLNAHLQAEGYSRNVIGSYPGPAKRFLDYLARKKLSVSQVRDADVQRYLNGLQMVKKRRGRVGASLRRCHQAAIHMLLRLLCGSWPPRTLATTARKISQCRLLDAYEHWMVEVQGGATNSARKCRAEAQRFLDALGERSERVSLTSLRGVDLDAFVQSRSTRLCRASVASLVNRVKSFLRFLHLDGVTPTELSVMLRAPRIYEGENVPAALAPEEIQRVLKMSRQVGSPMGRRDYAICMLLATYGVRAGEIVRLCLEDIDWRREILHVRHLKTNHRSELPLLPTVARALLAYLQNGRPKTCAREVFVRSEAPYRPFSSSTAVYHIVQRYLSDSAKYGPGRRGAHAFRHARAVGLLEAAVPLKTIGDVLGHRSVRSTMVYLKLATRDLRAVALEVPKGASL